MTPAANPEIYGKDVNKNSLPDISKTVKEQTKELSTYQAILEDLEKNVVLKQAEIEKQKLRNIAYATNANRGAIKDRNAFALTLKDKPGYLAPKDVEEKVFYDIAFRLKELGFAQSIDLSQKIEYNDKLAREIIAFQKLSQLRGQEWVVGPETYKALLQWKATWTTVLEKKTEVSLENTNTKYATPEAGVSWIPPTNNTTAYELQQRPTTNTSDAFPIPWISSPWINPFVDVSMNAPMVSSDYKISLTDESKGEKMAPDLSADIERIKAFQPQLLAVIEETKKYATLNSEEKKIQRRSIVKKLAVIQETIWGDPEKSVNMSITKILTTLGTKDASRPQEYVDMYDIANTCKDQITELNVTIDKIQSEWTDLSMKKFETTYSLLSNTLNNITETEKDRLDELDKKYESYKDDFIESVVQKMEAVYTADPSKKFFEWDTREFVEYFMDTFSGWRLVKEEAEEDEETDEKIIKKPRFLKQMLKQKIDGAKETKKEKKQREQQELDEQTQNSPELYYAIKNTIIETLDAHEGDAEFTERLILFIRDFTSAFNDVLNSYERKLKAPIISSLNLNFPKSLIQ